MSLIKSVGAGEQSTGFYKLLLNQSLKFNDGDNQYLTRTPSTSNQRTWTWSGWIKRGNLGSGQGIFGTDTSSTANFFLVQWTSSDTIFIQSLVSSSETIRLGTTRLFRDSSAWYHIVIAVDTTQGTASNRLKLYINGVQETDFSSGNATYPNSQNLDTLINNSSYPLLLGAYDVSGTPDTLDGYLAEINFIDGTALTADSFGETKDGIWIPKDTSGLTFGTNGFHLTFKDDVVSEGFNTVTYSGRGAVQSVSGLGFSPAMVWTKERDGTSYHEIHDVVRGANKQIFPNATDAEESTTKLTSFDGDGFSLAAHNSINESGKTYVGWCWEAGGTPTADNSAGAGATPTSNSVKIDGSNLGSALGGSIAATRLSANTTRGFSIGTFTKGSGTETVAHGLGAAPDWLIVKRTNGTGSWAVYHSANTANPETDYLRLNSKDDTADDATFWGDTAPTSTVFSIGSAFNSGEELVFYAWTEISSYSKFGSYEGNANTTGPSVTLGFEPALVIIKGIDADSRGWYLKDNTRNPANPRALFLDASDNDAEAGSQNMTFSSTGFQITNGDAGLNANGETYIYMAFADTREAAFFKDVTTNGNHFTPVNLDYRDSVPDTPTNNFCTLNSALSDSHFNTDQLSEGNLFYNEGEGNDGDGHPTATFSVTSGKWYWEAQVPSQQNSRAIGFTRTDNIGKGNVELHGNGLSAANSVVGIDLTDDTIDQVDKAGTHTQHASGLTGVANNDIFGFSVDLDGGTFQMYRNGSTYGSSYNLDDLADWQTHGMTPTATGDTYMAYRFNFGQDSSFAGRVATANANADGNGHGSFAYAPPSGYLALCSQNLPDVDIIDGTDNFNTLLYTGDGNSTKSISGVGFSPDWVWVKNRASTYDHALSDSVRGASAAYLSSNNTASESTYGKIYGDLTSFDSDGFSVAEGSDSTYPDAAFNQSSQAYVAWNWLAGTAFSNDASATSVGTIDSSGQVNTKAGFSIAIWSGNATAGATIAHGLSKAPEMLWIKDRDNDGYNWIIYHKDVGNDRYLLLNSTNAQSSAGQAFLNSTTPSNTVVTLGGNGWGLNQNAESHVGYFFHSVEGYSKVGSYTGNGNADGNFIFTGFRPAWILIKNATDNGEDWEIHDATRDPFNVTTKRLKANTSGAEVTSTFLDFVSNGVKIRNYSGGFNKSGKTFIYLAFAEQPFKFANAR